MAGRRKDNADAVHRPPQCSASATSMQRIGKPAPQGVSENTLEGKLNHCINY